jgi:hypothetical protein
MHPALSSTRLVSTPRSWMCDFMCMVCLLFCSNYLYKSKILVAVRKGSSGPDRTEQSRQSEPSRKELSRAEPSRAEPSRAIRPTAADMFWLFAGMIRSF